ncbi:MAG: potassium transporter KtrB [Ruminococcaceae bacterium]|nr:potassium transporter KtrB [Oscillospiraceae bacterium]
MQREKRLRFSTTQIILFSFLGVILIGSILLVLPISSATGKSVPYLDALFTATTSTCVTGLVTLPTVSTWSMFGQVVILVLIQIGGLGFIAIVSGLMLLVTRRMGIGHKLLIQDAFNLNTMQGLSKFIRNVLLGTLLIEAIGAALCMTVFVPRFGDRGIWISIFHSVSAFCNAGIDIFAENSLCDFATNPIINAVTSALIILGGIGYIVWWDVLRVVRSCAIKKGHFWCHLTLHSKIAITTSALLIFGGGLLILICEFNNPATIGDMSFFDKIQVSLFQSVTTRTAGFASVPQENLRDTTSVISMVMMLVGGSPVGTAGGLKTVTVAVLVCSALATVRNKNEATLFGRRVSSDSIRRAVAVVITFGCIALVSTVLLAAATGANLLDVVYESVSAIATVGLSRNFTGSLNAWGKLIVIVTMYLGRVGPISLAVAIGSQNESQNVISEPVEDISIG